MRNRTLAALAIIAIALSACTGATQSPSPTSSASAPTSVAPSGSGSAGTSSSIDSKVFGTNYQPQPGKSGGTIVMGEWEAPDTLNPFYTTSFATFEAIQPSLRGLLTITSDGKYIPDLGASIPTLENGGVKIDGNTFTVTAKLKPNLKWSDGQPLTMNDLKYTWQWANDKNQVGCSTCTIGFPDIDRIDVSSDGLTATIHFKDLYSGWLAWLTTAILPQHYASTISVTDAPKKLLDLGPDVASVPWSGPFAISAASKSEIDYKPNPYWTGGVSTAHKPYLNSLKFEFFGTKDGMIAAFKSGSIDLALDMTQADYPAIKGVDSTVGTGELTPAWQYEHLDLNNDPNHSRGNGLWDLNVRKAIAMAIDKPSMLSALFPGTQVQPACSPAPPGLWYAKEETCPGYDPNGARQLLQQSGYAPDSSGFMAKGGKEMNLELCTTSGNPTRLTELQKVSADLKAIGVKNYIKTADATSVVFAGWTDTTPTTDCSIYRGNYDIADFAYVITGSPYNDYYYTYSSQKWPEKGDHSGSNDTRFSSPPMDQALAKLKTDVDLNAQLKDAQIVQDQYTAGIPEIPLYYRSETTGVGASLGNWPGYAPSAVGPTWNVEDWYVK